ncbi:membrane fusion protein, multidrug efflux system [Paracoccus isoporae]|uniref:Membrane fusion protein, multidrug efflux system n=1 Tax=Paracoccus isoporae TaxID=591205 RepID=A0A1G6X030_9RHOB|nr:efflux RND transporter periplasmic adaptor subunit [Paracoccus isoporae]SDD71253.1 membrane fusion protein, multidrug efflux system [Paracoccus isoporae]
MTSTDFRQTRHRRAAFVTLLVLSMAAFRPDPVAAQMPGRGPQGPSEVGVMELSREDVPVTVELPGRAVAFQRATIRPKVGGEITAIPYEAGAEVEAGTVLFQLEDETLAAELTAEEVGVASAEAALSGATATVERYRKLRGSGVSQADLEAAEVALAAAQAALGAAEARRDLARLALRRTEITSPIRGLVAVSPFSVGDIVSAGQSDALTEVAQIDPIYVDVSESRARILRNQRNVAAGLLQRPGTPSDARLTLETGMDYDAPGRVLSPGAQVSATTGTIPIRVQFPNPDRLILPGQFVRVTLTIGSISAVLVPQRATSRAAGGELTAFLARDGRAVEVALIEQGVHRNAWIVTEGVDAGDALILDGLNDLRNGAEVTTVPVTIDENGVVRDAPPADGGADADSAASATADDATADAVAVGTTPQASPPRRDGG